ncbi:PIN domain protein [uncultured archaeon]|nr:PIN domain protein [uncultured archaeon]
MELVADTNVAISAILRPGMTRVLVLYPGFRLYAPEHIVTEIDFHRAELVQKSRLEEGAYSDAVRTVLSNIVIAPELGYRAFEDAAIAISPDHDDWAFFAVALQRNCAIWSNEKRLKNQDKVEVYNTEELLEILQIR